MTGLTHQAIQDLSLNTQGAGPDEELLRARPGVVDLHAAAGADPRVDREAIRQEQDLRRGQHARAQGRPRLRRDGRDLRRALRHRGGRDGARALPGHDRQPRAGVGAAGRRPALEGAHRVRGVPDHPGQQHPGGTGPAQALPHPDDSGRRRDRRGDGGHRRVVRGCHRRDRIERARHRPQRRRASASR